MTQVDIELLKSIHNLDDELVKAMEIVRKIPFTEISVTRHTPQLDNGKRIDHVSLYYNNYSRTIKNGDCSIEPDHPEYPRLHSTRLYSILMTYRTEYGQINFTHESRLDEKWKREYSFTEPKYDRKTSQYVVIKNCDKETLERVDNIKTYVLNVYCNGRWANYPVDDDLDIEKIYKNFDIGFIVPLKESKLVHKAE